MTWPEDIELWALTFTREDGGKAIVSLHLTKNEADTAADTHRFRSLVYFAKGSFVITKYAGRVVGP